VIVPHSDFLSWVIASLAAQFMRGNDSRFTNVAGQKRHQPTIFEKPQGKNPSLRPCAKEIGLLLIL
jgi:hypothetical protein